MSAAPAEVAQLLAQPERIEAELCRRSLKRFVKAAWHVLEPDEPFVDGWHLDAICAHLEAVSRGEITRLLINVPPGTMKSLLVSVFWPAWEWGPLGQPHMRYMTASHEIELATRDNRRMRTLVESEWFQKRWPLPLAKDQNEKTRFENSKKGFRLARAIKSLTGERAHRLIIDDPHSTEKAESEVERKTAVRVFRESATSRLTNPKKSAIVVVMQRLPQEDISGWFLANRADHDVHVMLPMRFEPDRGCSTDWYTDPRTTEGELLCPERFPEEVVAADELTMGAYAVAGQFQQRPAPRGGGMFKVDLIERVEVLPEEPTWVVRYWDKAGTEGGEGARTAGVKLGWLPKSKKFAVLHVVKGRWSALKREQMIRQTAEMEGQKVRIWIEQEPGSGGKESAESTIRNLAGFVIKADRPTGDKAVRAEPVASQVEGGNVMMLAGTWNQEFIDELGVFPAGALRDQADALSGAFNHLEPLSKRPPLEIWSS